MAANWGLRVAADDIARVQTPADFNSLIADALAARASEAA